MEKKKYDANLIKSKRDYKQALDEQLKQKHMGDFIGQEAKNQEHRDY